MPEPQTQPGHAVEEAQRMFRAVLAPWAADLLELRRRGLDRPGFRRACVPALRPRDDDNHTLAFPRATPPARAA